MRKSNRSTLLTLLVLAGCAGQATMSVPATTSGLQKGDDIVPWNPIHVAGPNKGTNACPICTYEARPALQIFMKDSPNLPLFAMRLEKLVNQEQQHEFKGFIIVLDSTPEHLKQLAGDLKIEKIGFCYPDPQTRDADLKAYKINPAAQNTVVLYKDYKVVANFVNLDPGNFNQIEALVRNLP